MSTIIGVHRDPEGILRVNIEAEPYLTAEEVASLAAMVAGGFARSIGRHEPEGMRALPPMRLTNDRMEYYYREIV